jgi:hypothetical protein
MMIDLESIFGGPKIISYFTSGMLSKQSSDAIDLEYIKQISVRYILWYIWNAHYSTVFTELNHRYCISLPRITNTKIRLQCMERYDVIDGRR